MATSTVSTGGVTTQGNRTYLFGSSSGINTAALVEVAYNARMAEADKLDVRITANTTKKTAYTQLQTLSTAVQTSLTNLRKSYGFSATSNLSFDKRSGTLSASNSTDPSKLLGVSIDAGTTLGSYKLEVVQKAAANRIGSNTYANPAAAIGSAGGFDIGLAGGASTTVNVTSGMSLNDLATAINGTTATSGVTASVLKVSATSYQLVLSANTTAKDITVSGITGTNVLQNIGVLNGGGTAANVLQASAGAILKLDDVTITRDTNQIDDLIPGVRLTIQNAEPGTFMQLGVTHDNSAVKNDILKFVEAYNTLRDFIVSNQSIQDNGTVSKDSVLFGDNFMKSMTNDVQALLAGGYGAGGTALSTLREIGITLDFNNRLSVNETTLDDALVSKYDQVQAIFTTSITSDNSNFAVITNTSRQKSISAALVISANGSGVTGVSVGGNANLFNFSGTSITGKPGTAYEGMTFAYLGTTGATVNINMKQGIADLIDNGIDIYADPVTGTIAREKERLDDMSTDMNERATRITERADEYRQKLIDRYASLEAKIAQSKSIIAQLRAILGLDKAD